MIDTLYLEVEQLAQRQLAAAVDRSRGAALPGGGPAHAPRPRAQRRPGRARVATRRARARASSCRPAPGAWSSRWARWPATCGGPRPTPTPIVRPTCAEHIDDARRRARRAARHPHRRDRERLHAPPGGHRGGPGGPLLRALRRPRREPGPPHLGARRARPAPRAWPADAVGAARSGGPATPGPAPSSASAICTAFSAAPLRRLSPDHEQREAVGHGGVAPQPTDEGGIGAGRPGAVSARRAAPRREPLEPGPALARSTVSGRSNSRVDRQAVAGEHRYPHAGGGHREVGDVQDLAALVAQLLLLVGLPRAVVDEAARHREHVVGDGRRRTSTGAGYSTARAVEGERGGPLDRLGQLLLELAHAGRDPAPDTAW